MTAPSLPQRIGAAIRRRREHAGLSQETLAEVAGVTAHYVSLLENGRRLPSLRGLERFSKALGASIAELIADEAPVRQAHEEETLALLRGLSADDRKRAVELLRAFAGSPAKPARRPRKL